MQEPLHVGKQQLYIEDRAGVHDDEAFVLDKIGVRHRKSISNSVHMTRLLGHRL